MWPGSFTWRDLPRVLWSLLIGTTAREYRGRLSLLRERLDHVAADNEALGECLSSVTARCCALALRVEALEEQNAELRRCLDVAVMPVPTVPEGRN